MLVLNLSCTHGHGFEGWFGSGDDYESQQQHKLLSCPICGDEQITRLPSAPRLNVSHLRGGARPPEQEVAPEAKPAPAPAVPAPTVPMNEQMQAQWLKAVAHVIKNTEDVGDQFAEEARRIHYGEAELRGIRGSATADDTAALLDEGIEVAQLPLPVARKGPVQ
nr:DUF1178 family protein [uncultured Roseateles sp.]